MKKRSLILLAGAVGIAAAAGFITRSSWMGGAANAQGPQRPRMVSVELAKAERKSMPVDVDADRDGHADLQRGAEIAAGNHHRRSAFRGRRQGQRRRSAVHAGQPPDRRPDRTGRGRAGQGPGAARGRPARPPPLHRLVAKGATTQVNVDNAKTQSDILAGSIKANQAALDNLKVQKSYTMIRAPFSGRISVANVKVGNFVRPADTTPLAVINQMAPVYVTFAVPQRVLVDLREAMAKGGSASPRPSRAISVPKPARSRWSKTRWTRRPAWSPCAAS